MDRIPGEDGELDPPTLARRLLADSGPQVEPKAVAVSGITGAGVDGLLHAIDALLPTDPVAPARFRFPLGEGSQLHLLHEYAVVRSTKYTDEYCEVEADVPASIRKRLSGFLVGDS